MPGSIINGLTAHKLTTSEGIYGLYQQKARRCLLSASLCLPRGILGDSGALNGLYEHLAAGKKYKYAGEIATLPLYFGIISVVIGLWQWFGVHKEGHWDYYSSTVAGGMFILLIAMIVRWFVAPEVAVISMSMGKVGDTGKYIHKLLGLNYVVLGILAGIIIVNVFKVPDWAANGVRLSRLGLKTGVILLGTLYSAAELVNLGGLSIVMIGFFGPRLGRHGVVDGRKARHTKFHGRRTVGGNGCLRCFGNRRFCASRSGQVG